MWKNSVKVDLGEIGCDSVSWILLAQDEAFDHGHEVLCCVV
jgi:hypothetical protein